MKYVITLFILGLVSCGSKQEFIQPTKQDIVESVYASVEVIPVNSYNAQITKSGIIQEIFVEEGAVVKRNEILCIVSSSDLNNRLVDATLNLKQAKDNYIGEHSLLESLELDIATWKKQVGLDSTQFKRQEKLWSQNIGSELEKDNAKIKWESSQNQLVNLQKKLIQQRKSLKNNYEKALNRVESERSILNDFILKSKMDGRVYSIYKEAGELISMQEPFAEIGSLDSFKLTMSIDEVDVTKVELEDTVIISLDAYPDQTFQAKLNKIYPKKNPSTQTFDAEAVFMEKPKQLFHGFSGEANILVGRKKEVLTIPSDYLMNNQVMTKNGLKSVKVGMRNLQFVEVLDGLTEEDLITKPE